MRDTGQTIGRGEPHVPHASISSFEGVVPKTTNWRSLGGGSESAGQAAPMTAAE
jgi:phthalate 4,5-dioxygenase oxygenase subunit